MKVGKYFGKIRNFKGLIKYNMFKKDPDNLLFDSTLKCMEDIKSTIFSYQHQASIQYQDLKELLYS